MSSTELFGDATRDRFFRVGSGRLASRFSCSVPTAGHAGKRSTAFSIEEDERIFSKPLNLGFFDRKKLENQSFEKQVPGSIPPGSALMACLAQVLLVIVILHDRSFSSRKGE